MNRLTHVAPVLLGAYTLLLLVVLFVPTYYVAIIGFDASGQGQVPRDWSLEWFQAIGDNESMMGALGHSLLLGMLTTVVSCVVGLLAARGYRKVRAKALFLLLMILPLLVPGVIMGLGWMAVFHLAGIDGTFVALLTAHVVWTVPWVFLYLLTTLSWLNPELQDAASDLGAGPIQAFLWVEFPLVRDALIGSAGLAFTLSFNEFVRTFFVSGQASTITTYIFGILRVSTDPTVYALSSLMPIVSLVLLAVAAVPVLLVVWRRRPQIARAGR